MTKHDPPRRPGETRNIVDSATAGLSRQDFMKVLKTMAGADPRTCGRCALWEPEGGQGACKPPLPPWVVESMDEIYNPPLLGPDCAIAAVCDAFQPRCNGSDDPEDHRFRLNTDTGDRICENCGAILTLENL